MLGERVEGGPEHAEDLAGLVAHDLPRLLVPEHRHGQAFVEVRIGGLVGLAQEVEAVDLIDELAAAERPAARVAKGIDVRDRDRVLEPFQDPRDHAAMRPGAGERGIEVVAAGRGREARASVGRDPASKLALLPDETAVLRQLPPELELAPLGGLLGGRGRRPPPVLRRRLSSVHATSDSADDRAATTTPTTTGAR